jgi:fructoselysine-6-P-deglycase FrlB-like protein
LALAYHRRVDASRAGQPDTSFDPTAPIGGPAEPWASTDRPSLRAGPPYHMTDMISAEPWLARRLLGRLATDPAAAALAIAIRETATAGLPIITTGCGTSEHGALGAADLLRDALRSSGSPLAGSVGTVQAFELALDPPPTGLVIGISHEGGTRATNQSLEAARAAGARTALITVTRRSPGARLAEAGLVVETGELDRSWCHTVGYLSPLLAAFAVGGHLAGRPIEETTIEAVAAALAAGMAHVAAIESLAGALADRSRLIVVASGADRTAGRELVLKVEEGTWLPSAYRDLETVLHGHWPGTDSSTGLVLVLADRVARPARVARARDALRAAREIGIASGAVATAGVDAQLEAELTPAGRVVVPESPSLPAAAAALFTTATALQLLTERLARARGTNPDPIRRDDPIYIAAGAAAEG